MRILARFIFDEGGTATVEFVIWFTVAMMAVLMIADGSYVMFNRSNAVRIVENANRLRSAGVLDSNEAFQAYVLGEMSEAAASGAELRFGTREGVSRVILSLRTSDIDLLGFLSNAAGDPRVYVSSEHYIEHWDS